MSLLAELLDVVPDGEVESVIVGLHWTAVSVKVEGQRYCGLSSTVSAPHQHGSGFDVPDAGTLTQRSARDLAELCKSDSPTLASIGTAALNALLQPQPMSFEELNAEEIIAQHGAGERVVIVGHFPFIDRIRQIAAHLDVLENHPRPGDLHASQAPHVIPEAKIIAITGMTFVNKTLDDLLALCRPDAVVVLLGASTPLHPLMFDHGIDYLCGAKTLQIDPVLRTTAEGAVYRQIAKAGLRLVTAQKPA